MYFSECESSAAEVPELRTVIERIDAQLQTFSPGASVSPDVLASFLNEKVSQVKAVIDSLCDKGLLRREEALQCPNCETSILMADITGSIADDESTACPECGQDVSDTVTSPVTIYRMGFSGPHGLEPPVVTTAAAKTQPNARATHGASFHEAFLKDPFANMPLLDYYSKGPQLVHAWPFAGKSVLFVLHFLRDLVPFVEAAIRLGLDPKRAYFFQKEYNYPQAPAVAKWLDDKRFRVYPRAYIADFTKELAAGEHPLDEKFLIVEDGGFFVPVIHRMHPGLIPHILGAVEQTTRGIRNAEEWLAASNENQLGFPVLSIAKSELKNTFEPPYIGDAVVRNLVRLLEDIALNGKKAVVMGYGSIGKAVAQQLKQRNARVVVFDPQPDRRLEAQQAGFEIAESARQAVTDANFVIGTSGNTSIDSGVIARLHHNACVVSASSETYEIDIAELEQASHKSDPCFNNSGEVIGTTYVLRPDGRCVKVLADGYPINFWGMDSMPAEASDVIMTLILLAAAQLTVQRFEPGIDAEAINRLAVEYNIHQKFLDLYH